MRRGRWMVPLMLLGSMSGVGVASPIFYHAYATHGCEYGLLVPAAVGDQLADCEGSAMAEDTGHFSVKASVTAKSDVVPTSGRSYAFARLGSPITIEPGTTSAAFRVSAHIASAFLDVRETSASLLDPLAPDRGGFVNLTTDGALFQDCYGHVSGGVNIVRDGETRQSADLSFDVTISLEPHAAPCTFDLLFYLSADVSIARDHDVTISAAADLTLLGIARLPRES